MFCLFLPDYFLLAFFSLSLIFPPSFLPMGGGFLFSGKDCWMASFVALWMWLDDFAAAQIPIVLLVHVIGLFVLHFLKQNVVRGLLSFVEQEVTTVCQGFVIGGWLNCNSGNWWDILLCKWKLALSSRNHRHILLLWFLYQMHCFLSCV